MIGPRRRTGNRVLWTIIVGLFVGALLSQLAILFMPESSARSFLTTSVSASLGPLGIDLMAVAIVLGPLTLNVNFLSVVGIGLVALVVRSWLY